jgi:hypothetical protein
MQGQSYHTIELFHPPNSLVVSRNLLLILSTKNYLLLIFAERTQHFSKIAQIPNLHLYLPWLMGLLRNDQFSNYSPNKSCKA